MFQSIYEDIKRTFRMGNMVSKIILINIGVWLFVNLIYVFTFHAGAESFYNQFIHYTAISSDPGTLIRKPWTILSHMFLHKGFWHVAWNMLLFFWFGRIVGDLIGDKNILPLYIYGGLAGALIFVITMTGSLAMGASAAVMATVLASAVVAPDYNMRLILIGNVKIKYIALTIVVLDIIGTAGNVNTGGHFAHLGGAVMGWGYITLMRNGIDPSYSFNSFFQKLKMFFGEPGTRKKSHLKVRYKSKNTGQLKGNQSSDEAISFQEKLNRILEKIKKDGYDNLSEEEKEFLYQASKK